MDRRRGSPPPPRGRMRPYDGPPMMDRPPMDRRRSRSPPDRYGRGRSPPPQFKRSRREDDFPMRYERDDFGRGGPRSGRGYDDYDRGPRPGSPDRYEQRHDRPSGPMTFKQFMQKQHDDPSPEEAQQRYKQYLVEHHGSEIKAEFESTKDQPKVRALYDPRSFEKALAKRNEEAAESRTKFQEDLESGALQPSAAGFNQGAGNLAPKASDAMAVDGSPPKEDQGTTFAPAFCWRPARVAADLAMARRLTRRLDFEKGLPDDNPLLPSKSAEAEAAQAAAEQQDAQDAVAAKEEGKAAPTGTAKRFVEVEEHVEDISQDNYQEVVDKLDLLLTYLWRVHGVDYYSGYELTATEYPQRLTACRLLRGPKPEGVEKLARASTAPEPASDQPMDVKPESPDANSHQNSVAGASQEMSKEDEATAAGVEACWNKRIADGDPLEAQCQRKKIEEELDKWIDSQIVCHADNKWGSQVSNKLFMARKFVVKHIRTKHEDKVQAQKDKIYDELYFANFKAAKQAEEEQRQQEAQQQHHQEGGEDQPMEDDGHDGMHGGRGGRGGRVARAAARGGRGGRGMPGMMPGMMMDPMALMAGLPPMMMGPGAFMPMMAAASMGMMPMLPPAMLMGAMRGGRGGRMPGMGGRGGRGGRGGVTLRMEGNREYYDLDNPQNNRAVLDYGDL